MKPATSLTVVTACLALAACSGEVGPAGAAGTTALVSTSPEAPGANCPTGGIRIDTGLDNGDGGETAGDGVLGGGEIDATEYVCNGGDGADGSDGSDGADGADGAQVLITVTDEPAGANCATGGERIDTGLDNGDGGETAGDGVLGAGEIDATTYVCDGEDGVDGVDSLITTSDEPPGSNCTAGGQRIDVGLDDGDGGGTAGNGVLEPGEIDDTSYVCNADTSWPAGAGIRQGLSLTSLEALGWTICHQDVYRDILDGPSVIAGCDGDYMMLACRNGDVDTLTLAAADERSVVVQEDAATATAHHVANGVGWYYTPDRSWGFFPAGDDLSRNSCDLASTNADQRLCWHTLTTTNAQGGYRCGQTLALNLNQTWQRLVLVK